MLEHVYNGATVYISRDNSTIGNFEEITGLRILDSDESVVRSSVNIDGINEDITYRGTLTLQNEDAKVLLEDANHQPLFTEKQYGKGKVYFLNYALETDLLDRKNAFSTNKYKIYQKVFDNILTEKTVVSENSYVGTTYHSGETDKYVVFINYSDKVQSLKLKWNKKCSYKLLYGDADRLDAGDACIMRIE